MIDVMIITYNEALNLPHSLAALQGWVNKVFVIDSGSNDGTEEIARSLGAQVVHHDWPGYAQQKNWGLQNLPFESDWILILDGDEVITEPVRKRLLEIAGKPVEDVPENGFFINRLTYFMARPIRHCGYFPSWNLRFFKRGKAVYEDRVVHEHMIVDDPVGYIREPMIHDDRRGLEHYVAKHNRYSTLEALAIFEELRGVPERYRRVNISRDTRRRRWLKRHVLPHVPLPWLWRFIYMYVIRLGFLDGRSGLEFCKFISMYDYLVALKLHALKLHELKGEVVRPMPHPALELRRADQPGFPSSLPRLTVSAPGLDGEAGRGPAPELVPEPAIAAASAPAAAPIPTRAPTRAATGKTFEVETRPPTPTADLADLEPINADSRATGRKSVSILILTLNEQENLPDCLASVSWSDDVVVFDSFSTDNTVEVAKRFGARVAQRRFDNWSAHQNWAMENIRFKHEWVFYLDADERMTPELRDELLRVANEPRNASVAYYGGRKNYFMGRWIKRSMPPGLIMRFFKPRHIRFERLVNPTPVIDGPHGYLRNYFLHYNFSKGMTEWLEKHNKYSHLEALEGLKLLRGERGEQPSLFSRDRALRRKALKNLSFRMPLRPLIKFLYMYFVRLGILDGFAGLTYCTLQAIYEYMIVIKMKELRRREQGQPI